MTETLRVEAEGETVSEAKWRALRDLELLEPSLDRTAVVFEVSEGKRGLLGVGYEPARVAASAERAPPTADDSRPRPIPPRATQARRLRRSSPGSLPRWRPCRVEIAETPESLVATCVGDDLGRLIGRHGQTLDALQVLAAAIVQRGEEDHRRWWWTPPATATVAATGSRNWHFAVPKRSCRRTHASRSSR